MQKIMNLKIRDGRLVLDGKELSEVESYRLVVDSNHKHSAIGELEIKMLVTVFENKQAQNPLPD